MTHYKLTLAYDGTHFAGYQVQPNQRTVQGVLQKALAKMAKVDHFHIDGSGRTDSGVHALGQVVSFDYPGNIPVEAMLRAMNSLMPLDVEIFKAEIVPATFHARYSATGKRYMYRVQRGRYTDPFKRLYTGHFPYKLDLNRVRVALDDLVGTHDFSSFAASGGVITDKVRTIYEATVREDVAANEVVFEFYGNGFLYNMVRILVATLLEIGTGRRDVHDFLRLFEVKDRQQARGTAPASGLYLKEVYYDGEQSLR
ncbi:tRNA pseudouridine(38-40) synthase TruA [Lacticaseibacillus mingshuiensis]|uniref:tRNA pseudouridine(38-40) synthase TruA n=1 Tax=Lacticaseibacillus mingshuiensis TaxID=2799574 RepID=UPI00194E7263|nr:tRNA pseudouridine(38-40) synthase TruA [Lacticaseibacillus mingshuiensis]